MKGMIITMCMAVPMKIMSIDPGRNTGRASYSGNEMNVHFGLISPAVGDYVLVHAGCAIEVVRKELAEEMLDIFKMLEESGNGY